jgi:tetratricopeptide (TPR) repeat protein
VFNRYYDPRALETSYQETRFDKPHNFVLEDLVAGGVPLLLARFFLLTAIAVEAFRLRDRLRGPVVAAALCAYVFRNLFAFDTIGPLLALALVAAWVDGAYREERGAAAGAAAHVTRQAPSGARAAAWFAVGAALVAAYVLNIRPLEATVDQYWGFQYFAAGKPDLAVASFKRAVGAATPYRWNFARDYATAVAEAHFYNPRLVAPEDVRDALAAMETVAAEHPWDAYNHYALVDLYNQTSDLDPPNHAAAAEREAAIALRLSPQRQEVYFSLAKTKSLEGDNAAALELLDEALELDPKVADAHFYYGLIAFVGHDAERGYSEIKQAIALGRAWKNSDEPRVVANFFADASHLDEAIDLYRRALGIRPTDQEAKIKLGIAYFLKGDRANARRYIEEVARDVDLTKSPSYGELEPVLRELGITP